MCDLVAGVLIFQGAGNEYWTEELLSFEGSKKGLLLSKLPVFLQRTLWPSM